MQLQIIMRQIDFSKNAYVSTQLHIQILLRFLVQPVFLGLIFLASSSNSEYFRRFCKYTTQLIRCRQVGHHGNEHRRTCYAASLGAAFTTKSARAAPSHARGFPLQRRQAAYVCASEKLLTSHESDSPTARFPNQPTHPRNLSIRRHALQQHRIINGRKAQQVERRTNDQPHHARSFSDGRRLRRTEHFCKSLSQPGLHHDKERFGARTRLLPSRPRGTTASHAFTRLRGIAGRIRLRNHQTCPRKSHRHPEFQNCRPARTRIPRRVPNRGHVVYRRQPAAGRA